ncbi:MAG: family 10 glycosylhydrolase [Candidatus Omnitrophica bacterium]|nr:family 10 glycosylhydrolase [Candidatus Omnitrophota bacterium]
MKRKIAFFFLCLLFILPAGIKADEPLRRALFVTVLQEPAVLSQRPAILELVDCAKKSRVEILYIQVYRANKAWFPSKHADDSPYADCVDSVGEDPLDLLISRAHTEGIKVYAWLNLLSLSANKNAPMLEKYGNGILTRNIKPKKKLEDYKIDNQYFLEPGDLRVRSELVNIVGEVLGGYPGLDGIIFDYIRYPDKNPAYGYTRMNIDRFKNTTGEKRVVEGSAAWNDWKRMQVTGLLKRLVKESRRLRPDIRVEATGCAPYSRAYLEAFQDWPSWLENKVVDSVTVMTYARTSAEFEKVVLDAKKRVKDFKKTNIAVGAYALGNSPDIFFEQLRICSEAKPYACAILHYGSLLENPGLNGLLTGDVKTP